MAATLQCCLTSNHDDKNPTQGPRFCGDRLRWVRRKLAVPVCNQSGSGRIFLGGWQRRVRPEAIIECLFVQIELLAKPTGNFGELRLALVIELRTAADEGGIPSHTRWPDYRYTSAFALRMFAKFSGDHAFEFRSCFHRLLRYSNSS